jgi:hypothetical protein
MEDSLAASGGGRHNVRSACTGGDTPRCCEKRGGVDFFCNGAVSFREDEVRFPGWAKRPEGGVGFLVGAPFALQPNDELARRSCPDLYLRTLNADASAKRRGALVSLDGKRF